MKELIMIIDGAANLKFVYLEGEMTLKDIQNIMMYQNTSMNVGGNVYRIVDGTLDLADLGVLDGLKGLEKLTGLRRFEESGKLEKLGTYFFFKASKINPSSSSASSGLSSIHCLAASRPCPSLVSL